MRSFSCWLGLWGSLISCALILEGDRTLAQIVPDETLGAEGSRIVRDVLIRGGQGDRIEGGAARGVNLFHSFREFNVREGERVYFDNPAAIANIFSRVTGNDISDIMGTLGVDGGANLYLLNPNGIIFGPNARLDVAGSFVASTSDRFIFPNGEEFSAVDPQAPPLLTINVPMGLQYGRPMGDLVNQANLEVAPGESLVLHGNTVTSEGILIAPGGTIHILGDRIALVDNAWVDVSSPTGGGTILVGGDYQGEGSVPNALRTYVAPTATLNADATVAGDGGRVIVWADEVTGFYGNIFARGGVLSGDGGFVEVSGLQYLDFDGRVDVSAPMGAWGTLLLDPRDITISNDLDTADVPGALPDILQGEFGAITDITINAGTLQSQVGNIILQATNNITIADGVSLFFTPGFITFTNGEFTLVPGGSITFTADADNSGAGDFSMDPTQTIRTSGRSIAISGANLTIGSIDTANFITSFVPVDAGNSIDGGTTTFTFTIPEDLRGSTIEDLNVQFSAAHTRTSDLTVTLSSPGNESLVLFSGVGGNGDNFQDTILDDISADPISDGVAPFNRTYSPTGTEGLAIFNGNILGDTWTLTVTDTEDTGQLYRAEEETAWGSNALGTQLVMTTVRESTNTINIDEGGTISATGSAGSSEPATSIFRFTIPEELQGSRITDLDVRFSAAHPQISDLTVTLTSPSNESLTLLSNVGGDGDNFQDTLLSDQATTPISSGTAPFNNTYRLVGSERLDIFNNFVLGSEPWTLTVANSSNEPGQLYRAGDNPPAPWNNFIGTQLVMTTVRETTSTIDIDTGGSIPATGSSEPATFTFTIPAALQGSTVTDLDVRFSAAHDRTSDLTVTLASPGNRSLELISGVGGNGDNFRDTLLRDGAASISSGNPPFNGTYAPTGGNLDIFNNLVLTTDPWTVTVTDFEDAGRLYQPGETTAWESPAEGTQLIIATGRGTGPGGDIDLRATSGNLLVQGDLDASSLDELGGAITLQSSGGNIRVEPHDLNVPSQILANGAGRGSGGSITLEAGGGLISIVNSELSATSIGTGSGGEISLNAGTIRLDQSSRITTRALETAQALGGQIRITANQLTMRGGSSLDAGTSGTSELAAGGGIWIAVTESVSIDNSFITVDSLGAGDSGNINLVSGSLELLNDAVIDASIQGSGNGGLVSIRTTNTPDVTIDSACTAFAICLDNSRISTLVGTTATGQGASILLETDSLSLIDGARIQAQTLGIGIEGNDTRASAGDITIEFGRLINVTGASPFGLFSGILASSDSPTGGVGGNITINPNNGVRGDLYLSNQAFLSTRTLGFNDGGDIRINVDRLDIQSGGQVLTSSTGSGDAGSIVVNAVEEVAIAGSGTTDTTFIPFQGITLLDIDFTENPSDPSLQTPVGTNPAYATLSRPNNRPNGFDYYTFSVSAGDSRAIFDIDEASFDTELFLFNRSTGTVLASNDDASTSLGGEGSTSFLDSYLDYTFSSAGEYVIGVGRFNSFATTAAISGNAPLLGQTYNLRISLENEGAGSFSQIDLNPNIGLSSALFAETSNAGLAGNIDISAPTVTISDGGRVSVTATDTAIRPPTLPLNPAGNITVSASTINLSGQSPAGDPSGLFAETRGPVDAGNIRLNHFGVASPNLNLTLADGAQASASTSGTGRAGDLIIDASDGVVVVTGNNSLLSVRADEPGGIAGNLEILDAQRIEVLEGAEISASNISAQEGGNILFNNLGSLLLSDRSEISASTESGIGGNLSVTMLQGGDVTLQDGSRLEAEATAGGTAGSLELTNVDDLTLLRGSGISVSATGSGDSGQLTIDAQDVLLQNQSFIEATTVSGQGGNILLNSLQTLQLGDRSEISASTESGIGGNLIVTMRQGGNVTLQDGSRLVAEATDVTATTEVLAGSLDLNNVNQLTLLGGSGISVSATGLGNSGQLTIDAQDVLLQNQSFIEATTVPGQGGNILLNGLQTLQLGDRSEISASTESGIGGNLSVTMLQGGDVTLQDGSRLEAEATAGGTAGSLELTNVDDLTLLGGSGISVSATGSGDSGQLTIDAQDVLLQNQSFIEATTVSGEGGNIFLDGLQTLRVLDSLISASTQGGTAGNLRVTARESVLLRGTGRFDGVRIGGLAVAASQGGTAGDLTIETARLTIEEGATATVSSTLAGDSGRLAIAAEAVTLNQGTITATTDRGNSGNVLLQGLNTLDLLWNKG